MHSQSYRIPWYVLHSLLFDRGLFPGERLKTLTSIIDTTQTLPCSPSSNMVGAGRGGGAAPKECLSAVTTPEGGQIDERSANLG